MFPRFCRTPEQEGFFCNWPLNSVLYEYMHTTTVNGITLIIFVNFLNLTNVMVEKKSISLMVLPQA